MITLSSNSVAGCARTCNGNRHCAGTRIAPITPLHEHVGLACSREGVGDEASVVIITAVIVIYAVTTARHLRVRCVVQPEGVVVRRTAPICGAGAELGCVPPTHEYGFVYRAPSGVVGVAGAISREGSGVWDVARVERAVGSAGGPGRRAQTRRTGRALRCP